MGDIWALTFRQYFACLILLISILIGVNCSKQEILFPFMKSTTNRLDMEDDASLNLTLSHSFNFFGNIQRHLVIHANGHIQMGSYDVNKDERQELYKAFPLANSEMLAPFWADVDTTGGGESEEENNIYYNECSSYDLITRVKPFIANHYSKLSNFLPQWCLIVTWYKVGYLTAKTDHLNTFQVMLTTDNLNRSLAIYSYESIDWVNSGGSSAQVGYNSWKPGAASATAFFTFPFNEDQDRKQLIYNSNCDFYGRMVFRVDKMDSTDNKLPPVLISASSDDIIYMILV